MVVFFERGGTFIRCETRRISADLWELLTVDADGTERLERFGTAEELDARLREVELDYRAGGWFGPYGRRA